MTTRGQNDIQQEIRQAMRDITSSGATVSASIFENLTFAQLESDTETSIDALVEKFNNYSAQVHQETIDLMENLIEEEEYDGLTRLLLEIPPHSISELDFSKMNYEVLDRLTNCMVYLMKDLGRNQIEKAAAVVTWTLAKVLEKTAHLPYAKVKVWKIVDEELPEVCKPIVVRYKQAQEEAKLMNGQGINHSKLAAMRHMNLTEATALMTNLTEEHRQTLFVRYGRKAMTTYRPVSIEQILGNGPGGLRQAAMRFYIARAELAGHAEVWKDGPTWLQDMSTSLLGATRHAIWRLTLLQAVHHAKEPCPPFREPPLQVLEPNQTIFGEEEEKHASALIFMMIWAMYHGIPSHEFRSKHATTLKNFVYNFTQFMQAIIYLGSYQFAYGASAQPGNYMTANLQNVEHHNSEETFEAVEDMKKMLDYMEATHPCNEGEMCTDLIRPNYGKLKSDFNYMNWLSNLKKNTKKGIYSEQGVNDREGCETSGTSSMTLTQGLYWRHRQIIVAMRGDSDEYQMGYGALNVYMNAQECVLLNNTQPYLGTDINEYPKDWAETNLHEVGTEGINYGEIEGAHDPENDHVEYRHNRRRRAKRDRGSGC